MALQALRAKESLEKRRAAEEREQELIRQAALEERLRQEQEAKMTRVRCARFRWHCGMAPLLNGHYNALRTAGFAVVSWSCAPQNHPDLALQQCSAAHKIRLGAL